METPILVVVACACLVAAAVWVRSARHRLRFVRQIERQRRQADLADRAEFDEALELANSGFRKEVHAASLYVVIALASLVVAVTESRGWLSLYILVAIPALISATWGRNSAREARITQQRFEIEKRAEETLAQEDLAPRAWAGRLAPEDLPAFKGFETGQVYQAGSGLMAGDFFDVFNVAETRVAAVLGDVAGHGIESSITAFQAKYLLRVFLRQFRDPAQALQELNRQMSSGDRGEEFISLVVVVFDTQAQTVRYASAGHPAAWLWHDREVMPLRATGPLVMLHGSSEYYSREIGLNSGDIVLMYTDGLAEVKRGTDLFGEDRVAMLLRRDPTVSPEVLCKQMYEAASDFSDGPIADDVAILAIRKV
jgi:serine phosphatase RsbU (regulator of sigma subunit)